MSLYRLSAGQKIASAWKKMFFLLLLLFFSPHTSYKFLLVSRHTLTRAFNNAFKTGTVNFANSLSTPSVVKKVHTGSKNSQGT